MGFSKKHVFLFVVLSMLWFAAFAYAAMAAEIDTVNTFRGVKFGEPVGKYSKTIERIEGMESPYGDLVFYQPILKEDETINIGEAEGVTVIYAAYKGKVISARVEVEGVESTKAIYKVLLDRFGEPTQSDMNIDEVDSMEGTDSERGYAWIGKNLTVVIICTKNEYGMLKTSLIYVWNTLTKEMNNNRAKAVKTKAVKDLD